MRTFEVFSEFIRDSGVPEGVDGYEVEKEFGVFEVNNSGAGLWTIKHNDEMLYCSDDPFAEIIKQYNDDTLGKVFFTDNLIKCTSKKHNFTVYVTYLPLFNDEDGRLPIIWYDQQQYIMKDGIL